PSAITKGTAIRRMGFPPCCSVPSVVNLVFELLNRVDCLLGALLDVVARVFSALFRVLSCGLGSVASLVSGLLGALRGTLSRALRRIGRLVCCLFRTLGRVFRRGLG